MATDPKEIQRLLDQLNAAYRALGERNPFENFDPSKITDAETEIEKLEIALEGVRAKIDRLSTSFGDLNKTLKNIVQEINPRAFNATKDFERGFKNVVKEAKQLQYEEEGISRLSEQQIRKIQERIKQQGFETKLAAERVLSENQIGREALEYKDTINSTWQTYQDLSEAQKAALEFLKDQGNAIDTISEKLDKRLQQEEEVVRVMGLGGNAIEGISKTLNQLGMGGLSGVLGINEAKTEMEDLARIIVQGKQKQLDLENKILELKNKPILTEDEREKLPLLEKELEERIKNNNELTKSGERTAVLNKGIATLGGNLKKNLTDPLVVGGFLIGQFIDALIKSDKSTGELAKSMNLTYSEANNLRSELNTIANLSGDNFVTTQKLQESLVAINKTLGTNAMINKEDLATFTKLRETAGLTNEELMGVQAISLTNGKTLKENTGEIMAQAKISSTRNGIALNEKEILKGIKDISAATTLTLGKNPKALADAIVQAKSLGMELKQLEQISQSLLNFEESIGSELEAELLTGRQLNLEQARYYALTGDVANLAKELSTQLGSAEEFGKLNVIQQEALAKSMGMGREELAKTLFVQEQLKGATGDEAKIRERRLNQLIAEKGLAEAQRILAQEGIDGLEQQASIGEQFNASMEKLKEIFVTMSPAILGILDTFSAILGVVGLIFKPLGAIMDWAGRISPMLKTVVGLLVAAGTAALYLNGASTFGVGIAIALAAIGGAMTLFESSISQSQQRVKDAKVDVKKGVTFSGEFGSVQLDEKDQALLNNGKLTAGTNLFEQNVPKEQPISEKNASVESTALKENPIIVNNIFEQNVPKEQPILEKNAPIELSIPKESLTIGTNLFEQNVPKEQPILEKNAPIESVIPKENPIVGTNLFEQKVPKETILEKITPIEPVDFEKPSTVENTITKENTLVETNTITKEVPIIVPPSPTIIQNPPQSPQPLNLDLLLSKMDKLEQTNALLAQLVKKDTSVYMDGAKVGKSIALSESRLG